MIGYYSKSISKLLQEIHSIRDKPFKELHSWKKIQLNLVRKNINLENKIRVTNKAIKELNHQRQNPEKLLSREESNILKDKISRLKIKLEDLRFILKIYKSIGDAIAYTFIHKLDIKPQNFKESAGFISEKTGLTQEIKEFKKAYSSNIVAILNDLTSVLKYCDITLCTENGLYFPLEVKSSTTKNTRIERQKLNAEKIFKYLQEDVTENLYGIQGVMQRHALGSSEINYIKELNKAIENSKIMGSEFISVEKGLSYYIAHRHDENSEDKFLNHIKKNFKNPMLFSLNKMKFFEQGHYPFSLSLTNPENYLDFLKGKYVIMILVDFDVIDRTSKKYKFNVRPAEFPYLYEFENFDKDSPLKLFKMSEHMFMRIVLEFVSMKWLLKDTFERFSPKGLIKETTPPLLHESLLMKQTK